MNETIAFVPQREYSKVAGCGDNINPSVTIAVCQGENYVEGYDAVAYLTRHLGILYPVYVVMHLPGIKRFGHHLYQYVMAPEPN